MTIVRIFFLVMTIFLGFGQIAPGFAQNVLSKGPAWSSLTPSQKDTLSTLEEDWFSLSSDQRTKWVQLSIRFERFPEPDQVRLKSRMSDWAKLSSRERRVARANFINSQNIPNDKKTEAWEAYQQLTPEERKLLSDEAAEKNKTKKPSLVNAPSLKN